MKRIRSLRGPVPDLTAYQGTGRAARWDGFQGTDAHTRLLDALQSLQHNLCAYCEIGLVPDDRQVEHVVPKGSVAGKSREFDPENLVACCLGGTNPRLAASGDGGARFWDPPVEYRSCGQAKGNAVVPEFVDPRTIPAGPPIIRVAANGKVRPDPEGCARAGVDPDRVRRTIRALNLNSHRLQAARKVRWDALEDAWRSDADDGAALVEAARDELLPDAAGRLRAFFTTARWFFGAAGERVLAEPPQVWI